MECMSSSCESPSKVTVAAVIVSNEHVQHLALVLHQYENVCDLYYRDLPFNCLCNNVFPVCFKPGPRRPGDSTLLLVDTVRSPVHQQ